MVSTTDLARTMRRAARPLLALSLALAASSAEAGDFLKKHHTLKYELVQGYILNQGAAPAQPTFVPVSCPVPVGAGWGHAAGCSCRPTSSPQDGGSIFGSPPMPSKQVAATPAPLFSTLASQPLPQPVIGVVSQPVQVQAPVMQVAPVQMVQVSQAPVRQVQLAQVPVQQVQLAQSPVQQVQLVSAPLIQAATTVASMPVQMQAAAVPVAAQALTSVQLLVPKQKHCLLGLGYCFFGHCH
ncbi:hypothetical protein [Tautonia plasticadhaerens]|uniref:Uncharacterized protein n=1 Tax=Tautonia plasticadhaerens TaxID=2527974 RepID=A0A518H1L2_9BACT|nr:hypothetical protein [Tautonia plasticadhaerens]QDV34729.1 hypothetical protein ElP_26230 [Tautonia plasticadhaerens]